MVPLNESEKFAVWETAREAIPRDRLFIAGAARNPLLRRSPSYAAWRRFGVDGAMIVTPHYYRGQMNPATLILHYRTIADASPIPIILYNVPANTNVDMDAATIIELARHENIAGHQRQLGEIWPRWEK